MSQFTEVITYTLLDVDVVTTLRITIYITKTWHVLVVEMRICEQKVDVVISLRFLN